MWVGKNPKKVKNCLRKAGEVFYQTKKVFLSRRKDLKPYKSLEERHRNPNKTRLSLVESLVHVVKESILWLGFKRPSMYWG